VPRYVTVDGQIVFDKIVHTPAGSTHPAHGAVTPVADHTFHGGASPLASPTARIWWDDDTELSRHRQAMERSFPRFSYAAPADGQPPIWSGVVDSGRGKFRISITMRPDASLPLIRVHGPQLGAHSGRHWIRSPHLYDNGALCVADQADWDPAAHTTATATAWAAHWLAAYTEWRMSRRWPVEGVHHHVDGN
jgi:hypothetical protein